MRLCQISIGHCDNSLESLQRCISVEYGESYFIKQQVDPELERVNAVIYTQALLLTAQYELAIEQMCTKRISLGSHAVHMAIYLNELGCLDLIAEDEKPLCALIATDNENRVKLNLLGLIECYCKERELPIEQSFAYLTLLAKSVSKKRLFEELVNAAWSAGGNISTFPQLAKHFFSQHEDSCTLIVMAANRFAQGSQYADSIRMYEEAHRIEDAAKLLSQLLMMMTSDESDNRRELLNMASDLIQSHPDVDQVELKSIVDLCQFFDDITQQKYRNALTRLRQMNIVPLSTDSVQSAVITFNSRSRPELQLNIGNILAGAAECLNALRASSDIDQFVRRSLREQASALVNFAALIPFQMKESVLQQITELVANLS
ncbi:hypothetical protein ACOME3_004644 [Neoechinorhynchus agilis]